MRVCGPFRAVDPHGCVPFTRGVNDAPDTRPYDVTLLALHRGRGYMFSFISPTQNAAAFDRRLYEAGRRSFRFTPK